METKISVGEIYFSKFELELIISKHSCGDESALWHSMHSVVIRRVW